MSLIQAAYVLFEDGHFDASRVAPVEGGAAAGHAQTVYDIHAVTEGAYSRDLMMGPMLQALLEERFHLRIHRETRETPVYALRVAEGGLKLPRFPEGSCVPIDFTQFRDAIERVRRNGQAFEPTFQAGTKYCPNLGRQQGARSTWWKRRGREHRRIFQDLSAGVGPPRDRPGPGLNGLFNFHFEYAPASISTAMEEQLRVADCCNQRRPADFLVIDRIARCLPEISSLPLQAIVHIRVSPPDQPQRRRIPRWLPQLLGYSVSAACLFWVLRGYPISELGPTLRSLDWRWGHAGGDLRILTVYVVHAWRWTILARPRLAPQLVAHGAISIYIGLFANEVLPLRTGELIRCYLLAHWNNMRLSLSFASAAVERVIDGFWMLVAFVVTASFVHGIPRDLIILVQVLAVLLLACGVALFWIVAHRQHAHAVLSESRWSATIRHIVEGLHLMGNPRTLGLTSLISLLVSGTADSLGVRTDEGVWPGSFVLGGGRSADPGATQHGVAQRSRESRADQPGVCDGARHLRGREDGCEDVLDHSFCVADLAAIDRRGDRDGAHRPEYR